MKDKLNQVLDATVGDALRQVIHDRALVSDLMTAEDVERIREEMERAQARKLQPYFVRSFFIEAFTHLGGEIREREPGRFEITRVPAELRQRDRLIGLGAPLLRRYERVTFDEDLVTADRRPPAQYLAPGHPLLDVTVDLIIERFDSLLQSGAVLVDERDPGEVPRTLTYLQHSVADGRVDQTGNRRTVSKRFEFVEVAPDGQARPAGWAPYLDLRPATQAELDAVTPVSEGDWVRGNLEDVAISLGVTLARGHLEEVRRRTLDRVDRVAEAVRSRLESEIRHLGSPRRRSEGARTGGQAPRERHELRERAATRRRTQGPSPEPAHRTRRRTATVFRPARRRRRRAGDSRGPAQQAPRWNRNPPWDDHAPIGRPGRGGG